MVLIWYYGIPPKLRERLFWENLTGKFGTYVLVSPCLSHPHTADMQFFDVHSSQAVLLTMLNIPYVFQLNIRELLRQVR